MQHRLTTMAILLCAVLVLAACTKEEPDALPEGAIRLTTEKFASDGLKMSVQDNTVVWEDGDSVSMGNIEGCASVHVNDGVAWIYSSEVRLKSYFLYPSDICDRNFLMSNIDVTIPATYHSRMVGTRQRLALPMGARNDSTNIFRFRHISAAVKVMLWNSLGSDVIIDTVRVTTNKYRINGVVPLELSYDNLGMRAFYDDSTDVAHRTVTVAFPFSASGDDKSLVIPDGDQTKSVQVPILPIGECNITIKVYGHKKDSTNVVELFSHTASSPALARNQMLTAKVRLVHIVDLSKLASSENYIAQNGDILTGTSTPRNHNKVSIAPGATVYLNNVNIEVLNNEDAHRFGALTCLGNATIVLMGTNTLKGGDYAPGLTVGTTGTKLTIKGDGILTATGGLNGPGIGGCRNDCGNILIESGTITAQGGTYSAGIGGAETVNCGNITITGGNVTARGGNFAAGIGSSNGSLTVASQCGDIKIYGGTVTAYGGIYAAGIGCGASGRCGEIEITSSVTRVEAVKGTNAPYSIGIGFAQAGSPNSTCTWIRIGGKGSDNIEQSPFVYEP